MQVTNIRKNGAKLHPLQLQELANQLGVVFHELGYMTSVEITSSTGLSISQGWRCFSINTDKLGYNVRGVYHTRFGSTIDATGSVVGWKRTDVPTWDQRVEFNHCLNDVLDQADLTARIKSGEYQIRDVEYGRYSERDWYDTCRDTANINQIETLTPEMEADAKQKRKEHRAKLRQAKKNAELTAGRAAFNKRQSAFALRLVGGAV